MAYVLHLFCTLFLACGVTGQLKATELMLWSVPLASTNQSLQTRVDFNLRSYGSLGLELGFYGFDTLFAIAQPKERNGLQTTGNEISLHYSIYSKPALMSGWLLALGGGYRQQKFREEPSVSGAASCRPAVQRALTLAFFR